MNTQQDADAIDEAMVRRLNERRPDRMDARRQAQPERRVRPNTTRVTEERRVTCQFCFQPGDHRSAIQCRRALDQSCENPA